MHGTVCRFELGTMPIVSDGGGVARAVLSSCGRIQADLGENAINAMMVEHAPGEARVTRVQTEGLDAVILKYGTLREGVDIGSADVPGAVEKAIRILVAAVSATASFVVPG